MSINVQCFLISDINDFLLNQKPTQWIGKVQKNKGRHKISWGKHVEEHTDVKNFFGCCDKQANINERINGLIMSTYHWISSKKNMTTSYQKYPVLKSFQVCFFVWNQSYGLQFCVKDRLHDVIELFIVGCPAGAELLSHLLDAESGNVVIIFDIHGLLTNVFYAWSYSFLLLLGRIYYHFD